MTSDAKASTKFENGDTVWVRSYSARRAALAVVKFQWLRIEDGKRMASVMFITPYYNWDNTGLDGTGTVNDSIMDHEQTVEVYRLEPLLW